MRRVQHPRQLHEISRRLRDSMRHATGKGWSRKAALLIGLPLGTCSVWPRKSERHSTANWGRGQNNMIIKNTTALKQKYRIISFSNPECTLKRKCFDDPKYKEKWRKASFKWFFNKQYSLFNLVLSPVHFKIKF